MAKGFRVIVNDEEYDFLKKLAKKLFEKYEKEPASSNDDFIVEYAQLLREDIGLYNIYDVKNYKSINETFYNEYSKFVTDNFINAGGQYWDKLREKPVETISDTASNVYNTAVSFGVKMVRDMDGHIDCLENKIEEGEEYVIDGISNIYQKGKEKITKNIMKLRGLGGSEENRSTSATSSQAVSMIKKNDNIYD